MDKDVLVVFSEMLQKQDRHTEILLSLVEEAKGSNENMVSFFQDQREINKQMLTEMKSIKDLLSTLAQLDGRLKAIENREGRFEERLNKIESLLKAS